MAKSDDENENKTPAGKNTKPLFLRVDAELLGRLQAASEEYGSATLDSPNKVAIDILDRYLNFWIQVKEREREELARQYQLIKNSGGSSPSE
jgi:hypothetical protein